MYDGDSASATRLGRFCGQQLPRSLVSSGLKLFIVFHTDDSVTYPGFVLNYATPFGEILIKRNRKIVIFLVLYHLVSSHWTRDPRVRV